MRIVTLIQLGGGEVGDHHSMQLISRSGNAGMQAIAQTDRQTYLATFRLNWPGTPLKKLFSITKHPHMYVAICQLFECSLPDGAEGVG